MRWSSGDWRRTAEARFAWNRRGRHFVFGVVVRFLSVSILVIVNMDGLKDTMERMWSGDEIKKPRSDPTQVLCAIDRCNRAQMRKTRHNWAGYHSPLELRKSTAKEV